MESPYCLIPITNALDLEAGRSDAVVADEVLARYYIKLRGPENYKVLDEDFGEEDYGIGVRKLMLNY